MSDFQFECHNEVPSVQFFEPPPILKRTDSHENYERFQSNNLPLLHRSHSDIIIPNHVSFNSILNRESEEKLTEIEAQEKLKQHRENLKWKAIINFFEAHQYEEWFLEKYNPAYKEIVRNRTKLVREKRLKLFWQNLDKI